MENVDLCNLLCEFESEKELYANTQTEKNCEDCTMVKQQAD